MLLLKKTKIEDLKEYFRRTKKILRSIFYSRKILTCLMFKCFRLSIPRYITILIHVPVKSDHLSLNKPLTFISHKQFYSK